MSSTYSSYKFELIGTGEQAGTWGTTTNTNLGTTLEQAIGGYVSVAFTGTTKTLTLTNSNAVQDARALYLNLTGAPGGAAVLEVPAIQKAYIIKNGTTGGFTVTAKVTGLTGVDIPNGKTMLVYNNGTDVVVAHDNFSAPVTINANSSSDALRINQLGAGNALIVEDETNPDSTPFVINATGALITGTTTAVNAANAQSGSQNVAGRVQIQSLTTQLSTQFQGAWSATAAAVAPALILGRSRGATVGTYTAVASGDVLGYMSWQGSDGTNFVRSSDIRTLVDGTVGTGIVPSSMYFRTTDSTGTLAVNFSIGPTGNIGIVTVPSTSVVLNIAKGITGNATSYGVNLGSNVAADVTAAAHGYLSQVGTDAAVTLANLYHFRVLQSTFGVGSAVTSQYGVNIASTMTGATNNYGFYSALASATGVWGFYGAGTANNLFIGNTRFGGSSVPTAPVDVTGAIKASGNITSATSVFSSSPSAGIGYSAGAGSTVTQTTSRTTSVSISAVTGAITLVSAAGSATYQSFTVNNTSVSSTDVIIVNQQSGTDKYIILVTQVSNFSFQITFATTGGTTTEQPVFNFAVIKGVAA